MDFFATFQFAGLVIGLTAGALSVRRRWDAVPGSLGALGVFVLMLLVADLAQGFGWSAVLGALALGPVVGVVPVGAGFFGARWLASRFGRSG
jgi:Kef-type K+ transport system membrane component KefB